jgi:CRP-like cAMP-binding protein
MGFQIEKYIFQAKIKIRGVPLIDSGLFKDHIEIRTAEKEKVIYKASSHPRGIYILKKGKVKISQMSFAGKEQIIYIYKRGELFGYRPILCEQPHPVTATTLEECTYAFIPRKRFLTAMDESPELVRTLLDVLSHEFIVWLNKINALGQLPVKERIVISLLILNEIYKRAGKEQLPAVINLSRENIARFSGTTVESLVRVLRTLKDSNIIASNGRRITVLNVQALETMLD